MRPMRLLLLTTTLKRSTMHPSPRSAGFTLLELLVAMAVFVLVSVSVYAALAQMLLSRALLEERYANLADVQRVLLYVERDLLQAVERTVKTPYGDVEPALKLVDGQDLSFSRLGADPLLDKEPHSRLLRLRYQRMDNAVWRLILPVLDAAQDTQAEGRRLLSEVDSWEFSAFKAGSWLKDWPPTLNNQTDSATALPQAVRVEMKLRNSERVLQHTIRLSRAMETDDAG